MNMKKVLVILLGILFISLMLTACGSTDEYQYETENEEYEICDIYISQKEIMEDDKSVTYHILNISYLDENGITFKKYVVNSSYDRISLDSSNVDYIESGRGGIYTYGFSTPLKISKNEESKIRITKTIRDLDDIYTVDITLDKEHYSKIFRENN